MVQSVAVARQTYTPTDRRLAATDAIKAALHSFVGPVDASTLRRSDLGPIQLVNSYRSVHSRRRYVHMYAAKIMAALRALRVRLAWRHLADRPLVSIGSGPGTDLMGWCFDRPRHGPAIAIDPLRWDGLGETWSKAMDVLLGPVRRIHAAWSPDGTVPSQLPSAVSVLDHGVIPNGSVVLLSFILNHLMDAKGELSESTAHAVAGRLREMARRECRVLVVDRPGARGLWNPLSRALGVRTPNDTLFHFGPVLEGMRPLYTPQHRDWRLGSVRRNFARVKALAFDGRHWSFVESA